MERMKARITAFWKDEEGLGTLEILLIIAVLVAIALLFRSYIIDWVQRLLNGAGNQIDEFIPQSPEGEPSE